jgi:hypothetical protein
MKVKKKRFKKKLLVRRIDSVQSDGGVLVEMSDVAIKCVYFNIQTKDEIKKQENGKEKHTVSASLETEQGSTPVCNARVKNKHCNA